MTDNVSPWRPDLVVRLTADTEPYLSCDACFDQADIAVEAAMVSQTVLDEPLRVHLLNCPACYEEVRSLAAIVASEYALSPLQAIARIDAAVQGTGEQLDIA